MNHHSCLPGEVGLRSCEQNQKDHHQSILWLIWKFGPFKEMNIPDVHPRLMKTMHCSMSHPCNPHLFLSAVFLAVFLPLLLTELTMLAGLLWLGHNRPAISRCGHHPVHCTALHCTALHLCCTVLHCSVLHYAVLYCVPLHPTVLCCTLLRCIVLCTPALHCISLHCSVRQVEISLSQHWGSGRPRRTVHSISNRFFNAFLA